MMKKILLVAFLSVAAAGCTGVKTLSTGLENEAFLEFVGNPNKYGNEVTVTIDDKNTFSASVKKQHSDRPKGTVYAIATGRHTVSVSYNDQIIYRKQIFVSAQETKKIVLP
ncbi:MAG: hypothetical protein LBP56_03310 [Odoribacteraceae bacterium]|jgi:hypothetical protein|nr:hypothetical protein [Odoribacteraceae bacterium]